MATCVTAPLGGHSLVSTQQRWGHKVLRMPWMSRARSPHIGHFFSCLSLSPAQLDGPPAHQSRHSHRDGRKHMAALPHDTTNVFSLQRPESGMSSIRSISFVFSYACFRLSSGMVALRVKLRRCQLSRRWRCLFRHILFFYVHLVPVRS